MTKWLLALLLGSFVCCLPGRPTYRALCIRHFASPIYNPVARQARLEGDVPVRVSVGADGKVENTVVLPTEAHKLLQKEASENVRRWTFEPNGKQEFTITYEFRLVKPEVEGFSPTAVSLDFPSYVYVTCNLRTIDTSQTRTGRSH